MSEETLKKLERQNEIIIALLGRMVFTPEKIQEIIVKKKQIPQGYINAYNACDGNRNVNELATIAGVDQSTLSPVLNDWEEIGIVFEVEKGKGKFYKKLYPI